MKDLTTKSHWDRVWEKPGTANDQLPVSHWRRAVRAILGPRFLSLKNAYNSRHVWRAIYPRYLPQEAGTSIIEIGSAPGLRLIDFHLRLGYEPFGVEYSDTGVTLNRRLFREHGLPEDHVIHEDFFSPAFIARYSGCFDVVLSWSFLEHFNDPLDVIRKHSALLKPGGTLVVQIPNLKGIYAPLIRFFRPEWLEIHNFEIMERSRYAQLFAAAGLIEEHCDYHGLFSFRMLQAAPDSAKRHLLAGLFKLQLFLNALFNVLFPRRGPENGWFSQELIYFGKKPAHRESA